MLLRLPHLWCHRDIKPENLLLVKQQGVSSGSPESLVLKVVDYGCSTFCVPNKRLCKKFGTVGTAAEGSQAPGSGLAQGCNSIGDRACLQQGHSLHCMSLTSICASILAVLVFAVLFLFSAV